MTNRFWDRNGIRYCCRDDPQSHIFTKKMIDNASDNSRWCGTHPPKIFEQKEKILYTAFETKALSLSKLFSNNMQCYGSMTISLEDPIWQKRIPSRWDFLSTMGLSFSPLVENEYIYAQWIEQNENIKINICGFVTSGISGEWGSEWVSESFCCLACIAFVSMPSRPDFVCKFLLSHSPLNFI